jgi:hypothetical protein
MKPIRTVRKSTKEKFKSLKTHCRYCGLYHKELHIEHIVPKSARGSSEEFNLTIACKHCNSAKGIFTLDEWFVGISKKREINYTKTIKYIDALRNIVPHKYDRNKIKYHNWLILTVRKNSLKHKRYCGIIGSLINKRYILKHDDN